MNKKDAIKYLQQLYPNGGHCWLDEQRIEAIGMAVKALKEEPAPKIFEDMLNAKTPAESLSISPEEHDKIVDECLYGKEPELVDFDDMPLDPNIQYASREIGIKAHAEDYSFNIESELFQQLNKEQQELWRKEIEQACMSGGYCGLNLGLDKRYDKEEPVSDELNTVAKVYADNITDKIGYKLQLRRAVVYGAKWQRQQDNNDANHALVEQIKTQQMCYEKGMADMKRQMMAKAIDGTARPDDNEIWCNLASNNLEDGDKIKVIVIKED